MTVLSAFLHHLAAFVLFSALFMELVLVKGELTIWSARKILLYDLVYGIAAAVLVVVGLLRVVYFEKGAHYYLHSVPFIVKVATFVLVALMSIYPTTQFRRWQAALKRGETPQLAAVKQRRIATLIHVELTGLALMVLCAALMAKGIGYFG
jgi:putative membrane protein